jgi:hypothetical protein
MNCQLIYAASDTDVCTPCDNPAVVACADCGTAICSSCRMECCGESFCEPCYDYHVTHACRRKPVQPARYLPSSDRTG